MNKIVCFFICCETKLIKISISRDKFFEMKLIFWEKAAETTQSKNLRFFATPPEEEN